MRNHGLGLVFLAVQIRGQGLVKLHDAVLKILALLVQGAKARIQGGAIQIDLVTQLRTTGLEVGEYWLDVAPQELQYRGLITGPQPGFQVRDVSAGMERQRREQWERTIRIPELENVTGQLQVGHQIGLNRGIAVRRRATNV